MLRTGDFRQLTSRYSDIGLAIVIISIVGMMIVPLPPLLLDFLVCTNIAVSVTLLLTAIYVSDALKIASFPTILLITTLFRLAIEVSATRLILGKADAGHMIEAFGAFVAGGNLVVGAVIFIILTMIQFIVVAKGSERVSEVGARFTLDAMPGKQMSIDAELRAGHIDHATARQRRNTLARESQFFGSMDGAMKFVKGDAIAGLVVLAINIVGGLIIGMVMKGMDAAKAAETYTILTIGEGLVAQIPALLISTAAGVIVTRVSSEDEDSNLGSEIGAQLLGQPKAIAISAGMLVLFGLIPGLPMVPFFGLAAVFGLVGYKLLKDQSRGQSGGAHGDPTGASTVANGPGPGAAGHGGTGNQPSNGEQAGDGFIPLLTPILVEIAPDLERKIGTADAGSHLTKEHIPTLRRQVFHRLGLPLPPVRFRQNPVLEPGHFRIRFLEVSVGGGHVKPQHHLAIGRAEALGGLVNTAKPGRHPDGREGFWVEDARAENLKDQWAAAQGPAPAEMLSSVDLVMATLFEKMKRFGHEFIGIQEAQSLLDQLEKAHPILVAEVVPKLVSPAMLADILRRLAEEGVSLRGLREILNALAEWAPLEGDPIVLVEHIRGALRRQITAQHAQPNGELAVVLLDPMIEESVREAIQITQSGRYLALEPGLSQDIIQAVGRTYAETSDADGRPALITQSEIRRFVRKLVESQHPDIPVLSYQELSQDAQLQPVARVSVSHAT